MPPCNHTLKVRMFDKGITQQMVADAWRRSLTYVSRRFTGKEPFSEAELAWLADELEITSTDEFVSLFYPSVYKALQQRRPAA